MKQEDFMIMMAGNPSAQTARQLVELSGPDIVGAYRYASLPGGWSRYQQWRDAIEAEILRRLALVPPQQGAEVEFNVGSVEDGDNDFGPCGE